jgi:hypothetical protein
MRFLPTPAPPNGLDQEDRNMKAKIYRMAVSLSMLALTIEALGAPAKLH